MPKSSSLFNFLLKDEPESPNHEIHELDAKKGKESLKFKLTTKVDIVSKENHEPKMTLNELCAKLVKSVKKSELYSS
jgi:hypothetical protein